MRLLLAALCIFLAAAAGYAQDENCSKPKVAVMFDGIHEVNDGEFFSHTNSYYPFQPEEIWLSQIQAEVMKDLQDISPNVQFVQASGSVPDECDYYFSYFITLCGGGENLEVPGWEGVYYSEYTAFWMFGKFGANSACGFDGKIISVEITKDRELMIAIFRNIAELGDLETYIVQYELEHPVPPRGPEMTVSKDKDYVSPLEGKRSLDIKIDVINCEGEAVYEKSHGQKVILPRRTDIADLKGTDLWPQDDRSIGSSLLLMITHQVGAKATYTLNKGIDAEKEEIKIKTCGRDKNVVKEQEITIYGLDLKLKPDRREIFTYERTEIVLTLNETDPDGDEYPVEGKDLQVKVTGLEDGNISTRGGYTTNDKGEVIMIYKAGNDDRKINITASFQPDNWPDKAEGKTTILVKPLEYDASLMLKRTYEHRVNSLVEDHTTTKFCETAEKKSRDLNETIESSINVTLKLTETAEMPMFNQTWEYYEPVHVNLASFNLFSHDKRIDYRNSTGHECASGGYETTVNINKQIGKTEIEGLEYIKALPWIVAFDNETGKAVKIIPAGYSVAYEFDERNAFKTITWSKEGDDEKSDSETKTRHATYAIGPVEDPAPDPTAKSSSTWIQDYIEEELGEDLPFDISGMIPETDPEDVQSEINPDVIVQFGDGKEYFGGNGNKQVNKEIDGGFDQVNETFTWQMTRKRRQ